MTRVRCLEDTEPGFHGHLGAHQAAVTSLGKDLDHPSGRVRTKDGASLRSADDLDPLDAFRIHRRQGEAGDFDAVEQDLQGRTSTQRADAPDREEGLR